MKPKWQPSPSNPVARAGEAHVWYCDFSEIRTFANEFEVLSEEEQQRAARFKTKESRANFVGSHIFLRRVLASYLRIPATRTRFSVLAGGKPCLDKVAHGSDLQFNLSHSHQCAACAIALGVEVGVDLERPDPTLCDDDTAKQVFGAEELRWISECDPVERVAAFYRGWTKKEAYAKCKGVGLSSDLAALAMGFGEGASTFDGLSLLSFQCPNGYVGTLAVEGSSVEVSFWALPSEYLIHSQ